MLGYSSIIVHLDASPHSAERLDLARRIAREHGTVALIGLLALQPREVPAPLPVDIAPPIPRKDFEIDPEHRRRARTIFDDALRSGEPAMAWAEVTGALPAQGVARAALRCDLVVLGQRDPDDPFSVDVPGDLVESVVMDSGKPALVIPFAGELTHVARRVLVAWKPTRECARAVEAALPFMLRAERVHVVSWGSDPTPLEPPFGIVAYLLWHGIDATENVYADSPVDVGKLLLSQAADEGSDLLVMGCYGHHRLRELLLGGATRTVLRTMTLPVLMSH